MNNLNLGSNANSNVANSFNQIGHLNDLNNSVAQNSSLNTAIHSDHTDLFVKNNVCTHRLPIFYLVSYILLFFL